MKIILLMMLSTVIFQSCKAQKSFEAILIIQSSGGGYREFDNIIALNHTNQNKIQKQFNVDGLFLDKSIVNERIYKQIHDYIINNCITKSTENKKTSAFILIHVCTNDTEQICYLVEKEQIVPYFKKMIQQIKGLSRNNENKDLLGMLENIIDRAF